MAADGDLRVATDLGKGHAGAHVEQLAHGGIAMAGAGKFRHAGSHRLCLVEEALGDQRLGKPSDEALGDGPGDVPALRPRMGAERSQTTRPRWSTMTPSMNMASDA